MSSRNNGNKGNKTAKSTKPFPNDGPLVPEHILKRRHDLDALKRKQTEIKAALPQQSKRRNKKAKYVLKPETILAQARSRRNHTIRYQRVKKKGMQKRASTRVQTATKTIDHTAVSYQTNSVNAKLVLAIRIRPNVGMPLDVRRTLQSLGLDTVHTGCFLDYQQTKVKLHLVEPWIVYGTLSRASILELLQRRGYAKIDQERVALSDNTIVENQLGQYNILCCDDLVEELLHPESENQLFETIARDFLDVFHFGDSKSHFERTILKRKDGKLYGDVGQALQDYLDVVL